MRRCHFWSASAAVLLLSAGPTLAQTEGPAEDASAIGADMLAAYDADSDGTVSPEEFHAGAFGDMDVDASGDLSETEIVQGFGDPRVFAVLDADQSGAVSEDELATGFEGAGIFAQWDTDASGGLSQEEFAARAAPPSEGTVAQ